MDGILHKWGLNGMTITPIDSPSKSTWDVGGKHVLKRYTDTNYLSRSLQIANLLAAEGVPVVTYIQTVDGYMTVQDADWHYCLMTKLQGCDSDLYVEPDLAHELGRELARLHIALTHIEPQVSCNDNDLLAEWRNYIKPGLGVIINEEWVTHVEIQLCDLYQKLPHQLIHRDVHTHNVLFADGKLTGWLDFDLGRRDVKLFDLAYLLGGLLSEGIQEPAKVEIWRLLYQAIIDGYNEINTMSANEHEALPVMMIVIELLFVSYWSNEGCPEQSQQAQLMAKWLYDEGMRSRNLTDKAE